MPPTEARTGEDPLVRSARREAAIVLGMFVVMLTWTITAYGVWGGPRAADELRFVWGVPDWAFWGLVVPWCVCVAFAIWFGTQVMCDERLGDEQPEADDA